MSSKTFRQRLNYEAPSILSTTDNINLKTVATTDLFTVPTGKKAVITGVVIRLTNVSVFVSAATLGIGIASGESDIIPAIALTGFTALTMAYVISALAVIKVAQSEEIIKVGVDIAAVATAMVASIDLIGYLI